LGDAFRSHDGRIHEINMDAIHRMSDHANIRKDLIAGALAAGLPRQSSKAL
jgi:hypothetical protein